MSSVIEDEDFTFARYLLQHEYVLSRKPGIVVDHCIEKQLLSKSNSTKHGRSEKQIRKDRKKKKKNKRKIKT